MIIWAFVSLILATIVAIYGYRGTVSTSTYIAKLFFFVFFFIFISLVIMSLFSTAPPPPDTSMLV